MIDLVVNDPQNQLSKEALKQAADQFKVICSGEERYAHSLGWMNPQVWAGEAVLDSLIAKAEKVRDNADIFVLIGVGGSNQAARAVIKALDKQDGPEILYSGNNLSPHSMNRLLQKLDGRSVYINVIAKNFETLEPGICFRVLRAYLEKTYGNGAAERITVTGTPNSELHNIAKENGYTFLTFPEDVGGRFSALSDVGLFPMAVAGVDIKALVKGALDIREVLLKDSSEDNMAVQYASMRQVQLGSGMSMEMLAVFESRLRYFGKWWVQLFAESEGKDGRGLFPVFSEYSEDLHSVGQFVQDGTLMMFETFLTVEDAGSSVSVEESRIDDGFGYLDGKTFSQLNDAAQAATIKAHSQRFTCMQLKIEKLDEYCLGQLLYFFELSCYLSGRLIGINPFNQPGVEAYKQVMFDILGK